MRFFRILQEQVKEHPHACKSHLENLFLKKTIRRYQGSSPGQSCLPQSLSFVKIMRQTHPVKVIKRDTMEIPNHTSVKNVLGGSNMPVTFHCTRELTRIMGSCPVPPARKYSNESLTSEFMRSYTSQRSLSYAAHAIDPSATRPT